MRARHRTYEKASRNTFDINAIPILKEDALPHYCRSIAWRGYPRICGAHSAGSSMAGADAVIYETHQKPEEAFSEWAANP